MGGGEVYIPSTHILDPTDVVITGFASNNLLAILNICSKVLGSLVRMGSVTNKFCRQRRQDTNFRRRFVRACFVTFHGH
jgi:hypothetical protein